MAESLSQEGISALTGGGEKSSSESVDGAAEGEEKNRRHIKPTDTHPNRFYFEYHSPLIKEHRIILNPDPSLADPHKPGRVVVRSIDNYVEHQTYLSQTNR